MKPEFKVDPSLAVSYGAAVIAADLQGIAPRTKDGTVFLQSIIKDVTAHGLGVEVIDEKTQKSYNHVLIPANSKLPADGKVVCQPLHDDAPEVEITIYQGESDKIDQCKLLQKGYILKINNPRKRDLVKIDVKFVVNTDGIVEIHATESAGGELHEKFRHPAVIRRGK